ncbi:MAG: hypothetical protein ACRDMV_03740 [Streptosporangiales bacterium]
MPKVIVPVGLNMGQDFTAADPGEQPARYWEVHLGGVPAYLTREEATAWAAAFLDPAKHASREVTRASLEAHLRAADDETTDPSPVVARLLERGLLVEFDPVNDSLESLFSRYQLYPLAQGFGNSPEQPRRYEIGFAGRALIDVDANVYAIWSYALTESSLWDACAGLAAGLDADLEPNEEPLGLTAEDLARDVAMSLPVLVTCGCGFLDPLFDSR